jgi:quercetin dioxygenase-like cupin family protein
MRIKEMKERTMVLRKTVGMIAVATWVVFASAAAQGPSIKRTPVGSIDFPPGFTTVTAIAEVPAGVCAGRHIHQGIESGYVLEGDVVLKLEGKPEQVFKAGQWFPNPANTPHDVCSVGGFKTISTYVVEKGKPLALPAP